MQTNGAFANLSPNAITSLLQAGLDKGVFHSVNKLFWALADNPEAVYTPNQWYAASTKGQSLPFS
jgi:hypothetical protein